MANTTTSQWCKLSRENAWVPVGTNKKQQKRILRVLGVTKCDDPSTKIIKPIRRTKNNSVKKVDLTGLAKWFIMVTTAVLSGCYD